MNYIEFESIAESLLQQRWIFAKTMPENPHWYTLRKEWNTHSLSFNDTVMFMRQNGYKEKFKKTWYSMFDINDMKYWTMGAPLRQTILINRTHKKNNNKHTSFYDQISSVYDNCFTDNASIQENNDIFAMIPEADTVLDIGCGTGLFLDYRKISPEKYTGIDPSSGMLTQFIKKHEAYQKSIIQTNFESFYHKGRYDLVVSLFGSPNYIDPLAFTRIPRLLNAEGKYFLMFYKPEYTPAICLRSHVNIPHIPTNIMVPGTVKEYHNFLIVTNIGG